MTASLPRKALGKLALFLPGIFLLGFNIGTGSVTTMVKAGATYGMSLLWTVLVSCMATYVMIGAYGRYTLVTGETALQAFRKHIHPAVGIFFIVALTAGVSGSVMGVMGIVAEISFEWSKTFIAGGIAPLYWAIFFISLVYFIFWNGRTQIFERSLAVIVAIMAASFVVNFFILMPPPIDIAKGLIPSIPNVPDTQAQAQGPLLLIASMVGPLATSIFAIGIIAAGVSSQFPNVLMLPWLLCDYQNSPRDMTLSKYRLMVFFISLLGLVVPLFEARPIVVMIVSQAFNVVLLPATVASIAYLGNKKDLMGEHRHSFLTNVSLAAIFVFSLVTSFMGWQGLKAMILG